MIDEHQLMCIGLSMERQLKEAQESRKKARLNNLKEDEKYYIGQEDAFELIIGKLNLINKK